MSTNPIPINARDPQQREAQMKAQARASLRSDILYISGGMLVTIGFGMIRIRYGLIVAGSLCLVFPCLELVTGFLRGLRKK